MEDSRHTITLDNREKLNITGVTDVLSYDEENIVAQTEKGILIIRGDNLHIANLSTDKGILTADGNISSLAYDNEPESKGSLFGKIFK